RWTTRDQWHVTLRFLGPVPDPEPVLGALDGLAGSNTEVRVEPAVGRFGQRVLHVPVAGLETLAGEVVRATAHLGRPPDDRPFAGHLTLARVAKDARVDLRALTGGELECSWMVDAVCLMESHLRASGARYELRQRFPLEASGRPPTARTVDERPPAVEPGPR
ncbi:MAG: RNA 2',3'-cyclic phosphodiesterase, partial [Actinomycetota bacterium]|nr:RNA 2',3'-cyclic phosphodiesterase [Actinomycetota bacterium]